MIGVIAVKYSLTISLLVLAGCTTQGGESWNRPVAYIVDEDTVTRSEPPPHGAIGSSLAYRISDGAEDRTMEFRRRTLSPGSAVGVHPIGHDEVYYVLSGTGIVTSDGVETLLGPGFAAYLYEGAEVGIRQTGDEPLDIIITYPIPGHPRLGSCR